MEIYEHAYRINFLDVLKQNFSVNTLESYRRKLWVIDSSGM